MKVNNDIFSDDFYMMGIDADDFRKAIRKVSDETACCKVNSANFRIISVIDSDRDGFLMMRLNPTALTMKSMIYSESYKEDYYFADKNENYGFLSYDLMRRNGITDAMIDEIRRCGFFLLYAMGDREMIIIPSESSLNDLYKEFDISKIDSGINPLRNLYLSSLMARCKDFQILLRRKEDIYRLCGTASQKHMYLSLEDTAGMLLDGLMKNHSDAQVMSWHVSQRETAVNLSFNDRTFMVGGTEVRPGAQILASDFGQTAMAIRNILYVNEAPLILSFKSSLRNIGSALPETVLSSYEADGYHLLDNVQKRIEDVIGKMKPEDKDIDMQLFASGRADILVATSVIEVGVDVPNASVMVIESAERFGLSQLHQLRGRVGRGAAKSYCILMSGYKLSKESRKRLELMCKTTDGFLLAEEDMKMRGPGDLEGTSQSGLAIDLHISSLYRDGRYLESARRTALDILDKDPLLQSAENHLLTEQLRILRKEGKDVKDYSSIS